MSVARLGTPEWVEDKRTAGVRARQAVREAEGAYSRARSHYQRVAAECTWGRRDESELAAAEQAFEDAERALQRAQAAADGFDGSDRLRDIRSR